MKRYGLLSLVLLFAVIVSWLKDAWLQSQIDTISIEQESLPAASSDVSISSIKQPQLVEEVGPQKVVTRKFDMTNCQPMYELLFGGTIDSDQTLEQFREQRLSALLKLDSLESKRAYLFLRDTYAYANENLSEPERLAHFIEYINIDKISPLIGLRILKICSYYDGKECSAELIQNSIDTDPQNASMWLLKAMHEAKKGKEKAAIQAIQKTIQSPFYNTRLGEEVLIYSEALKSIENTPLMLAGVEGIGLFASLQLRGYSNLLKWCKAEPDNHQRMDSCLSLGRDLSQRSHIILDQSMGFSMQRSVQDFYGNTKALANLERQQVELQIDPSNQEFTSYILVKDEQRFRQWLKDIDMHSEQVASQKLLKDADIYYAKYCS